MTTAHNLRWTDLVPLVVGGAVCLPVIMVGHNLATAYGLSSAFLGIVVGNAFLYVLAMASMHMAMDNRKNTPDNARRYFGARGVKVFAITLLAAKICWFAIQLNLMSLSLFEGVLGEAVSPQASALLNIALGAGIVLAALRGIKALRVIASASMPILFGTMGCAVFFAWESEGQLSMGGELRLHAISLAMATAITFVVDMPTYFRHVRSRRDGLIAVTLLFGVVLPVIEGLGTYIAYKNPGATIVETLHRAENPLWNFWVTLFLLLAGWTTNNVNLYSGTVCLGSIMPRIPEKRRTFLVGGAATLLSLTGILVHFTMTLQVLGVIVVSLGGAILASYLVENLSQGLTFFGWMMGSLAGLGSVFGVLPLTGIPLVDAFILAFVPIIFGVFR